MDTFLIIGTHHLSLCFYTMDVIPRPRTTLGTTPFTTLWRGAAAKWSRTLLTSCQIRSSWASCAGQPSGGTWGTTGAMAKSWNPSSTSFHVKKCQKLWKSSWLMILEQKSVSNFYTLVICGWNSIKALGGREIQLGSMKLPNFHKSRNLGLASSTLKYLMANSMRWLGYYSAISVHILKTVKDTVAFYTGTPCILRNIFKSLYLLLCMCPEQKQKMQ